MPTYAVDYTGSASANRIIETKQLSAANFRNYWVVIPDYAPFYRQGLVVKNASTNDVLVENVHYYLTHEFREASLSIGKPIFGSISFIRSAISFDITIEYQTLGGNWVVNINDIGSILANMIANPRITRWTQVQGYPATFPPINHDVSADPDLTGMADVVSVLNGIIVALGQRNQQAPIQQPSIVAASIPETLAGVLTNKAATPAGVKAVVDTARVAISEEIANSTNGSKTITNEAISDIIGESFFVNDAYAASIVDSTHVKISAGNGWFGGLKVNLPADNVLTLSNVMPVEITNTLTLDSDGNVLSILQNDLPSINFTNYLTYGNMPEKASWVAEGAVGLTYKQGYNSKSELTAFKYVSDGTNRVKRFFYNSEIVSGDILELSCFIESTKSGTIWVGLGSKVQSYRIYKGKRRYRFSIACDVIPLLSFYAVAYDASANYTLLFSELQIVKNLDITGSTFSTALDNAAYSKTNTTITTDSVALGSFSNDLFYDKVLETTTAGEHTVTRQITVKKGFRYSFKVCAKTAERNKIQLYVNGSGFAYGTEQSVIIDLTTGSLTNNQLIQTPIVSLYGASDYAPGNVYIEINVIATADGLGTFGIRGCLSDNSISYAGTATSGYLISMFKITSNNSGDSNNNLYFSTTKAIKDSRWNILGLNSKNYATLDSRSNRYATLLTNNTSLHNGSSWIGVGLESTSVYNIVTNIGTVLASESYTVSFEVKAKGCSKVGLTVLEYNNALVLQGTANRTYDLTALSLSASMLYTGTINTGNATITNLTNGWVRITLSFTKDAVSGNSIVVKLSLLDNSGNETYDPIPNYGLYVAAPKVEIGNTYTTYAESLLETVYDIDYIDTFAYSRTKAMTKNTGLFSNYLDFNNNVVLVNSLATCSSSPTNYVTDKRNVLYTKDALIKGKAKVYDKATNGDYINPNTKTICTNGSAYYLKPLALLNEGDSYTFVKENGLTMDPTINTSADGDIMVFFNYNTNSTVTDTSAIYNTQGPMEVTVLNGKFHVFF